MITKSYHLTTANSPLGIVYTFEQETNTLVGIEVRDMHQAETLAAIFQKAIISFNDFWQHWTSKPGITLVEITANITFEIFWKKYDDAKRSSKKRSLKLWEKLDEKNRINAYFFFDVYMKNKGAAEKKYCETYLNAEMWNN